MIPLLLALGTLGAIIAGEAEAAGILFVLTFIAIVVWKPRGGVR